MTVPEREIILYYATNRSYKGGSDPTNFFDNVPNSDPTRMRYGVYPVRFLPARRDYADGNLRVQPREEWFDQIKNQTMDGDRPLRRILIFVHGYNNQFHQAAYSAAKLAASFGEDVVPVFYSWPSKGTIAGYFYDENEVDTASWHFVNLIAELHERMPLVEIDIIAHSMGNRVALGALQTFPSKITAEPTGIFQQPFKFASVALVAADVDRNAYQTRFNGVASGVARRVYLYVSGKDRALWASRKAHMTRTSRLGENFPEPYIDPKAETVDVSAVDADFLGHGYLTENRIVANDLVYAVREGMPAKRRAGLMKMSTPSGSGDYWWVLAN